MVMFIIGLKKLALRLKIIGHSNASPAVWYTDVSNDRTVVLRYTFIRGLCCNNENKFLFNCPELLVRCQKKAFSNKGEGLMYKGRVGYFD